MAQLASAVGFNPLSALFQNLPCQLHSLMEAVLLLSEAILDTAEYRSQHAEVLQHMMELVDTTSQKQGESLPIVKKATQLLKARY